MSKYIHYFNNENDFDEMRSVEKYYEPWLSFTKQNKTQTEDIDRSDYNKTEEEKERERLLGMPLTFVIQSGGNIRWNKTSTSAPTRTIEYSKNSGEWTSITSATGDTAPSISVESGDTIQFRGNNANYGISSSYYNYFSGSTCSFSLKGNIMSLINSTDFSSLTTLESAYTFYSLFRGCTGLTDASNLLLPATTLANYCYEYMFYGCNSLTTTPELPATTLAIECYYRMFSGCNSLTTTPELPATTLAEDCYVSMFVECTSLTTAPTLPATTLASGCYYEMFRGCTSLTQAPALPATNLSGASYCYASMFQGCTSLTTAPALPATNLSGASGCYSSMFAGCSSLVNAPELPATTLSNYCYSGMFQGCTSLTTAPALSGTTLAEYCYRYMFSNCTSLTQAPELPATTLASWCYYAMFTDCRNLNSIKCLATNISARNCTTGWVDNVASTGTFVKNPNMTGWTTGTSGIPSGWTVQDAS